MNSLLMRLAVSCVRRWTRLYTSGMPQMFRETRRAEIESDLWEFQSDVGEDPRLGSVLQMLFRLLIGIPDDLGWRMGQVALADTVTQEAIALSAGVAGAALFIGALWLIHADAVRGRPAAATAGPASALDQEIERTIARRARNVRRSEVRLPLLTTGVVATVGVSTRPQLAAHPLRIPAISPVFEVASIKLNPIGAAGPIRRQILPGGRFVATNIPVRQLIGQAYRVQSDRLVGGPRWLATDGFDIDAKADGELFPQGVLRPLEGALQALLADRFKLVVHFEFDVLVIDHAEPPTRD